MRNIILASGSPRRRQLLDWAEINFEVLVPGTDESFNDELSPEDAASQVAIRKARAVQELINKYQHSPEVFPIEKVELINTLDKIKQGGKTPPILAADTIVVINQKILGKPADKTEAAWMLNELSGQTHQVITGVCILSDEEEIVLADTTEVEFHELSTEQINFYIEKYKPYDKAGAYAIQEWIGVAGIKSVKGDFYNVMGLPVSRVLQHLARLPA
jgi:septum formation protein